ncbi:MAG: site-specific DNA-methyltransferase [Flavobacterium sp.]
MDGTSLTPEQEKLNALRQILPEAFSEGKIDWEKLKATLGEDINFANERYVLNWAGKSDAFKVLQTPTTKTLVPAKEESVNFDETENIFIEGENLEVLKVLQKSYFGKVKMIYIDPPYNTGNDSFIYPDKFSESKADYEKRVGDKDEEGYMTKDGMFKKNSKENGQYHSNWLNMMMPRLYLAKNLLRQDGVIFVSIDDNEVHNLRLLMNEIFGEENFVAEFDWRKKTGANDAKDIAIVTESILLFAKNHNLTIENDIWESDESSINQKRFKLSDEFINIRGKYYLDTLDRGGLQYSDSMNFGIKAPDGGIIFPNGRSAFVNDGWIWKWGEKKVKWGIENKFLEFVKSEKSEGSIYTIKYKVYEFVDNEGNLRQKSGRAYSNLIHEPINQQGNADFANLFDGKTYFSNPKPIKLIQYFIKTNNNKSDIILDFFAGSGSMAHAVMDLNKTDDGNRKYICVQLPELCDEKSEAYKAGYKTIAEISKERIRRAGKKIQAEINTEIKKLEAEITKLQGELPTEENKTEITNLKTKIEQLQHQDLGFKVLKLEESNFKQWQQIDSNNAVALAEQMKLFVDPVSETATIENMVYELLLKSGKDLNSPIEKKDGYYKINRNEMILLLEIATQEIIETVITEKPIKVIALDKLFKGNDQLKTNTVLQMKEAGIEFKTI